MTGKKSKGSKSDSQSKKKSRNSSPNCSTVVDDKKQSLGDIQTSENILPISTEELSVGIDILDNVVVEQTADSTTFTNEPTLTELIIERYDGLKVNGRFEGLGTAYFVNGNIYEGTFNEGTMHGTGKFIWKSEGTEYEGDFYFNEITGKGKYLWSDDSSYKGDLMRGIRHGQGVYKHSSGLIYSGLWVNGKRHGIGLMNYDLDGKSFYEGEWNENVIEGVGFRQYPSGNTYEGEWYRGKRHGKGTMKWLDRNEQYTGQWKNGTQTGYGQHIWLIQRIKGSQYSLRNIYEGDFVDGKRDGYGVFIYPSGARYEGYWVDNKKCGMGKFVYKNGRHYEGLFEDDKIKELSNTSGQNSSNLGNEKIQKSMMLEADNMSARMSHVSSVNTISPNFQLYLDHILIDPQILNTEEESIQIQKAVLAHLVAIRKIYQYYSILGEDPSIDNTYVLTQMQFWRFLKDCCLHYNSGPTIAELDRALAESVNPNCDEISQNPKARILFLSFVNYLISIGYLIYAKDYGNYDEVSGNLLAKCFEDIMKNNVLPNACNVGGVLYRDIRQTKEAMTHFNQLFEIYKDLSYPKKNYPNYLSMKMRDFLVTMKKLDLIDNNLTAKEIVRILSLDNPNVCDDQFVCLEDEITFYEFFEAMTVCATVFVTKDVIDFHMKSEELKSNQLHEAAQSDVLDDSETDHTLTVSRPISGESNKIEDQEDDKNNVLNQSRLQSGKTKVSSVETAYSQNRKGEPEKTQNVKKTNKSPKNSKPNQSKSRKQSVEKDVNVAKLSILVNDIEKVTIPQMEARDDESLSDSPIYFKTPILEPETRESNDERSFNFWTHQLHIFFYNYFFPATTKFISISKKIQDADIVFNI